jgi:hypothetical protein
MSRAGNAAICRQRDADKKKLGESNEISRMGCGSGFGVRVGAFGGRAVADENAGE